MRSLPSTHPNDFGVLDTDALRDRFLVSDLFAAGDVRWALAADDRILLGGVTLSEHAVEVSAPRELHVEFLCSARELAIVALDDSVESTVDGERFSSAAFDVLFIGRGTRSITLSGRGRVYLVSAPAHSSHPISVARRDEVFAARLGEADASNERTVRRYIHADGVASANLVLGITTLEPGSVWNTMPAHTHQRRTEVYLYAGLGVDGRVLHLAGPPNSTRSLIVADGEAVISPGWSVHTGAGTSAYSFVWAMAGENQDYADMDAVDVSALR